MDGYLVGLIGSGIGTSLSPHLHEREAAALGVRYHYRILDLDRLGVAPDAVGGLAAATPPAAPAGLTRPHPVRQRVLARLAPLSPDARAVGAVNTVTFLDGRAVGHNTDLTGFSRALTTGLPDAKLDHVVLLGAGGAGAAV